ncbi:hypothetical protein CK203_037002 [Vitis vinifera]|uniref:Uncharacterized protein n=1 Tax=Vitis vinifera TaxID=29760 RepID=A0A438IVL9_VITVI|nr:hypothetical protein CK203_037002 [Vitis vinifera]
MEEGLLVEEKTADKYGGIGGIDDGDSSSSITAAVVMTILVTRLSVFSFTLSGDQGSGNDRGGLVRSLGIGRFLDWGTLDAHGSAGGLLICWDNRTLEVIEMEVGNFSISYRLRNMEDGLVWMFTRVERSNQGRLTSAMRRFAQVVDELELIDLPLQGGLLTWSGGRNNQAWARLDRFLVTPQDPLQGHDGHFTLQTRRLTV